MRQARVKPRAALVRRKEALFSYLLGQGVHVFERDRLVSVVGAFLREYGAQFGGIWLILLDFCL